MADEMEVDMSFSDVTDMDISMADADISKLLNGTQVPNVVLTPHTQKTRPASPSHDYADANNTLTNDEDVAHQTVAVKNVLNSTRDVADNGNVNSLNSTFVANNEHAHAQMADISSIANISIIVPNCCSSLSDASKTSDFSSSDATVLENPDKCTNQTSERICTLLNIATNVGQDSVGREFSPVSEQTSEKSEEDVYEDALPLQEEIVQISDGTTSKHDPHTDDSKLSNTESVKSDENVLENDAAVDLDKANQAGNIQLSSSLTQMKRNSSLSPINTHENASETLRRSLPANFAGEYHEERLTGLETINDDVPIVNSSEREDVSNAERTTTDCVKVIASPALNERREAAKKPTNWTGDDCDTSHLLMLNHSVTSFESPGAMGREKQAPASGLLDCTLDSAIVAEKVLQAANRKNLAEPMPHAKECQTSLSDKTLENGVENKENIKNTAAGDAGRRTQTREKPRPSLLLQFDPLPSLKASVVNGESPKVAVAVRPAFAEAPKSRLIDVDVEHDLEHKRAMDAVSEEKMNLIQEVNRLKLELNQVKQENTTLMLEIQKKEEVYLKAEANNQMRESQLKTENKQLLEKMESLKEHNDNEELMQAKKQTKEAAETNKRLVEENVHYKKIMNEYEATLSANNCEKEKLKAEHATVTQHLAALEVSFSDTITKYDRCKEIIAGFSRNEETLQERLAKSNQIATKYEERYETLKSHANAQLDKANKDLLAAKDAHRTELAKLNTIVKRLEIKNASLRQTLEQKTAECAALASLCDEMTGAAMH